MLSDAIPSNTSKAILSKMTDLLQSIVDDHIEYNNKSHHDIAPAAHFDVFTNGIIHHKLPDDNTWRQAIKNDKECSRILDMIKNPALVDTNQLKEIHFALRQPLRESWLYEENGIIFIKQRVPFQNVSISLRLVPSILRNIIFIAFHSNPIGGHLSLYQTMHRIRLRFYWPNMVKYIQDMINRCPGCKMANATIHRKNNHLYSFPIDAPFRTIHIDIYTLGKTQSFDGIVALFIVVDHMTSFAVIEPVTATNSDAFSKALMKILLTHGLCHTVIIDADSKFKATFSEVIDFLKLNKYELSKGNHQAMLVERFNKYLNKALKIFTNERSSNRTYVEGALLAAYAWNSAPVSGTDISRSLLVMGREFNFPIDFSTDETFSTRNDPKAVFEYTKQLIALLKESREIYRILIEEHRAMHRELKNAEISKPRSFELDDLVLIRRQVQSNKKKELVDKSQYAFTGPWKIVSNLQNGSYLLQHINNPNKKEKRHASMIELCPSYFIPQKPLIGAHNSFSKIHKDLTHKRFKDAGVNETPIGSTDTRLSSTVQLSVLATEISTTLPPFPSISELDEEYNDSITSNNNEIDDIEETNDLDDEIARTIKPESNQMSNESFTDISVLLPKIINSDDKLFFISHNFTGQDRKEWKVVQIDSKTTMALNPNVLKDGKFLVNILIQHPNDSEYHLTQRRFWPYYHHKNIAINEYSSSFQLIRPAPESEAYAKKHNLSLVRAWVNLTHTDVNIFGPFNFAISNGRKTIDRIHEKYWQILRAKSDMFDDDPPSLKPKIMLAYSLFSPFHQTFYFKTSDFNKS